MNNYMQMLVFITVVEEQGFTKAADRLAVTPTAVSKQIKHLEQRLGQQLLERDTRKMLVTDIGQQFYWHCKQVEQKMQQAEAFIQTQQDEPQGRLRILSNLVFGQYFLNKHLNEFHQRYPLIQLEVELADRLPDMEREQVDVVVGFNLTASIDPRLRRYCLFSGTYTLCATANYLQKYGVPQTPADLKHHKLLSHPFRQPTNRILFKDGTQIYMDPPDIIVNNLAALLQLCCDGAGIFLTADIQVGSLIKQGTLVQLLPEYPLEDLTYNLFYSFAEYEQRKIRCFIDFLVEKIKIERGDQCDTQG